MNRVRVQIGTVVLFIMAVAACGAETLESVEQKIAERMSTHKSIRFKQKSVTDMTTPQMQMKSESESTACYVRRPENRYAWRVESRIRLVRKVKDQPEEKEDGTSLMISDGRIMYMLNEGRGNRTAAKTRIDPARDANPFDAKSMFKQARKYFDLKLLPDEKVEGAECWVIESTPKKEEEGPESPARAALGRSISYYDKNTGVVLKSLGYDQDGKLVSTSTVSEVKLNESIPDEQFVFKAPPGVEVMDMTGTQESTADAQQPAPEAKKSSATDQPAGKPEKKEKKEDKPVDKAIKGLFKGLGK